MSDYEAKHAYQDLAEAQTYDTKRFGNFRGRLGDALDKRALSKALKLVTQKLSPSQTESLRVLDVPCGTGRVARFLAEQGYHVFGADISREMLLVAATKMGSTGAFGGFCQTDASNLSYSDNTFDCIISVRFMGHIPGNVRGQILAEFRRLSPYAIIEYSIRSRTAMLRRQIGRFLKTGQSLPQRWPWHIFDRQKLEQELQAAGFDIVNMWPKLRYLSDSWYVLVQRR